MEGETAPRRMRRRQLHLSNKPCCNGWDKYLASQEFQPPWVCNSPSSDAWSGEGREAARCRRANTDDPRRNRLGGVYWCGQGIVEQVVNRRTFLQSRRLFEKGDEIRRHRRGGSIARLCPSTLRIGEGWGSGEGRQSTQVGREECGMLQPWRWLVVGGTEPRSL